MLLPILAGKHWRGESAQGYRGVTQGGGCCACWVAVGRVYLLPDGVASSEWVFLHQGGCCNDNFLQHQPATLCSSNTPSKQDMLLQGCYDMRMGGQRWAVTVKLTVVISSSAQEQGPSCCPLGPAWHHVLCLRHRLYGIPAIRAECLGSSSCLFSSKSLAWKKL